MPEVLSSGRTGESWCDWSVIQDMMLMGKYRKMVENADANSTVKMNRFEWFG